MRLAFILIFAFTVARAEDALPEAQPVTGPRVEITLNDGHTVFWGMLLQSSDGVIKFRTEDGAARTEKVKDVKSLSFVSGDAPLTKAEQSRLKELADKDDSSTLTSGEVSEFLHLRERAPLMPSETPQNRFKRLEVADSTASRENSKDRIDQYIAMLRKKLKRAQSEEEVRDLTMFLALAYHHAGYTLFKTRDLLQKDVEDITNPELRKKILNRPLDTSGETPRPLRPDLKR